MKKGAIAAVIAVLAIVLIAAFVMMNKKDDDDKASSSTTTTNTDSSNSGSSENGGSGNSQSTPSGSQSGAAQTDKVGISDMAFTPKEVTVKKGTTVTWTNNDSVPHNVIGDGGGPQSDTMDQGDTYSFTFNEVGTFSYECTFHPGMTGKVTVVE